MRIESERLVSPLEGVGEIGFQVEREVVRNELREGYEIFGRQALAETCQRLFPDGHRFGRQVIGTHESLDRLTLEGARQWARTHSLRDHARAPDLGRPRGTVRRGGPWGSRARPGVTVQHLR